MRLFYVIGFFILVVFDTLSQVSFKLATIHASPLSFDLVWFLRVFSHLWISCSIIGYTGAFLTYITIIKHAPIGPAFAASHLEVITVMLASVWLFNEHISFMQCIGAILIITGITLLAVSESKKIT
jgi:multidrug transporter EmrE-like cation transporter